MKYFDDLSNQPGENNVENYFNAINQTIEHYQKQKEQYKEYLKQVNIPKMEQTIINKLFNLKDEMKIAYNQLQSMEAKTFLSENLLDELLGIFTPSTQDVGGGGGETIMDGGTGTSMRLL